MANSEFPLPRNTSGDEIYLTCPYEQAHCVRATKMLNHMIRCRRNYMLEMEKRREGMLWMHCKFNIMHQIPAPEILFHENCCPDRKCVTGYLMEHISGSGDRENPQDFAATKFEWYETTGVLYEPHPATISEAERMRGTNPNKLVMRSLSHNINCPPHQILSCKLSNGSDQTIPSIK